MSGEGQESMLTIIEHEGFTVRTVTINDEPHFVAADLAEPLGIRNIRDKIRLLDSDEKGVAGVDTLGGRQQMTILTEPGLINLIISCPKSRQKDTGPWRYRRWVTHEVLPSIHRTGEYRTTIARLTQELAQATTNNTFLRQNRLYHIAWSILSNNPRNYYQVKNIMSDPHTENMLTWEGEEGKKTPYVKPRYIQTVRALIQNLVPS
jgi:prophage antirepressor-like protein